MGHTQNIHSNSFSTNPFKPAPAMLAAAAAAPSVPVPASLAQCSPLIVGKPSFCQLLPYQTTPNKSSFSTLLHSISQTI